MTEQLQIAQSALPDSTAKFKSRRYDRRLNGNHAFGAQEWARRQRLANASAKVAVIADAEISENTRFYIENLRRGQALVTLEMTAHREG